MRVSTCKQHGLHVVAWNFASKTCRSSCRFEPLKARIPSSPTSETSTAWSNGVPPFALRLAQNGKRLTRVASLNRDSDVSGARTRPGHRT